MKILCQEEFLKIALTFLKRKLIGRQATLLTGCGLSLLHWGRVCRQSPRSPPFMLSSPCKRVSSPATILPDTLHLANGSPHLR